MAHLDRTVYFDELYGGSRNSGFIQLMLAKSPKDFNLDAIKEPSLWLQTHYTKKNSPEPKKEPLPFMEIKQRRLDRIHKEAEDRYVSEVKKKILNFENYYPDIWKTLNLSEKTQAYKNIDTILDIKTNSKGYVYEALKTLIDDFDVPSYAKRGYDLWVKNDRKNSLKTPKGRTSNTAYDKMQRLGAK